MKLLTIGFTKKPAERFFELLKTSGAKRVVDVRINTASQLAGFAKKDDLAFFLREICAMEYVHLPCLAPTKELLSDYRKGIVDWKAYERQFMDLLSERKIEQVVDREMLHDSCLLCSEDQPHNCHRRLVAEYLNDHWGGVEVKHLGLKPEA